MTRCFLKRLLIVGGLLLLHLSGAQSSDFDIANERTEKSQSNDDVGCVVTSPAVDCHRTEEHVQSLENNGVHRNLKKRLKGRLVHSIIKVRHLKSHIYLGSIAKLTLARITLLTRKNALQLVA